MRNKESNISATNQNAKWKSSPCWKALHSQYKVHVFYVFYKKTVLDGPLGKTKHYALCIEFQERGSPHAHAFVWVFNVPRISDETEFK